MIHFVAGGDRGYVARMVCLARTFEEHGSEGRFWLAALDDRAAAALRRHAPAGVTVAALRDFAPPRLRAAAAERPYAEYLLTAKPFAASHVLDQAGPGEWVVWVDADMGFFAPAEQVVPAGDWSVLLTPHHYTAFQAFQAEAVGRYNAGVVGFRNDERGRAALGWWADRCVEWCGLTPEPGRFGDQKYLEDLPGLFGGVYEVPSLGVNAAPWNTIGRRVWERDGRVFIDDDPLVLYHFSQVKCLSADWFDLWDRAFPIPAPIRRLIYRPYVRRLAAARRETRSWGESSWRRPSRRWIDLCVGRLRHRLSRQHNIVYGPGL